MIRLVNVTHHYGFRRVLHDVDLHVREGELVVLMGPNGCGKTTLMEILAGVLDPFRGHVEIGGIQRRSSVDAELAIRRRVAYLPDMPWLPEGRTGREFLIASARLYGVEHDRALDRSERLLALFELAEKADSPIHSYSCGQKKKIAVCGALVTEAPILLLDEPFSGGLDPAALIALKGVLQGLARRSDVTAVVSTPVPELVEEIAERVAVLRDGRVAAFDTIEGLRRRTECADAPFHVVFERLTGQSVQRNLERYFSEDVA